MTLPKAQSIEIPLGGAGLQESTGSLFRAPGVLSDCVNGVHGKAPELRKRRGFTLLDTDTTVFGETIEGVFVSLGVDAVAGGELVIIGRDYVYGVASPDATVDGHSLVRRGPSALGNLRAGIVHSSPIGEDLP